MQDMPRPRPRHIVRQVTQHGRVVWYFRRGKGKRIRLPDEFGSKEFMEAYEAALAGTEIAREATAAPQTLSWLVSKYRQSVEFKNLAPETQRSRGNILKAVCKTGGGLKIAFIDRQAIAAGRDRRSDTPHAAVNYMKAMSRLFDWAVDAGYARENPVLGVKRPRVKTQGFVPWTDEDIIQFCQTFPVGTKERLAMDIFLFTGLRRGNACRIGPQHVKNGVIEYRASKNDEMLFITIRPPLARSMEQTPTGDMAFLTTRSGRPFKSPASFGNWFGDACKEAGLKVRGHGLRKKAAQLIAENGGTNPELKAMFGWRTDDMAGHYTREANKRRLAKSGAEKLNVTALKGEGDG